MRGAVRASTRWHWWSVTSQRSMTRSPTLVETRQRLAELAQRAAGLDPDRLHRSAPVPGHRARPLRSTDGEVDHASRISTLIRLLPLPFDSVFMTSNRPTSPVERTCVPPSACLSRPTMSTTRISVHRLGDQVDLGADQVLVHRPPSVAGGTTPRSAGRPRSRRSPAPRRWPEALGQRVELEVHASRQRLHVPARHRHASTRSRSRRTARAARCGCASADAGAPSRRTPCTVVADRGQRVEPVEGVPHDVALLAHVDDRRGRPACPVSWGWPPPVG